MRDRDISLSATCHFRVFGCGRPDIVYTHYPTDQHLDHTATVAAELRRTGRAGQATTIKKTRWALLKNPPDLTGDQREAASAHHSPDDHDSYAQQHQQYPQ